MPTDGLGAALICALLEKDLPAVHGLVSMGADVDFQGEGGFTPLIVAATHGYEETVALFLTKGARVDRRNQSGFTALMGATEGGYQGIIRRLLEAGASPNLRNDQGATALHIAAAKGHEDAARCLLRHGADPRIRDETDVIGRLLEKKRAEGRNPSVIFGNPDRFKGLTAAQVARATGHESVAALIDGWPEGGSKEADAEPEVSQRPVALPMEQAIVADMVDERDRRNRRGQSPLDLAAGDADLVSILSRDGAYEAGRKATADRASSWFTAIDRGDLEALRALLGCGYDIETPDEHYHTGLARAALAGNVAVADWLLSRGAKDDIRRLCGLSALTIHCACGHRDRAEKALRDTPDDLNAADGDGHFPLSAAVLAHQWDLADWLISVGAEVSSPDKAYSSILFTVVRAGDAEALGFLLARGLDVNRKSSLNGSALETALYGARDEVSLRLIEAGIDLAHRDHEGGSSLLVCAVQNGKTAVARRMIEAGASTLSRDNNGWTELSLAAAMGDEDRTSALLAGGAAVDAPDDSGETPLMHAVWCRRTGTAGLLLRSGADPNHVSTYGCSGLGWAAVFGERDLLDLLRRHGGDLNAALQVGGLLHCAVDGARSYAYSRDYQPKSEALRRYFDVIDYLLGQGLPVDHRVEGRNTPLLVAAMLGVPEVYDFLLSRGADSTVTDGDGLTPRQHLERALRRRG